MSEAELEEDNEKRTFASNLKEAREAKGLSLKELSKIVGISVRELNKYETEKSYPPSDELIRLKDALNVSYRFLFSNTIVKYGNITWIYNVDWQLLDE